MFKSLNRKKMVHFFASKGIKDFKNSKLFWKFYSASIRIKSDCSISALPNAINDGSKCVNDPEAIGNAFIGHFSIYRKVAYVGHIGNMGRKDFHHKKK